MLTNDQRFALANRMMSIVDRMMTAKEGGVVEADAAPTKTLIEERDAKEQAELDEALTHFAAELWRKGPDDLFALRPEEAKNLEGDEA